MEDSRFALRFSVRGMKILRFPLTRFFLAILFFVAFLSLSMGLTALVLSFLPDYSVMTGRVVQLVFSCSLVCIGYILYVVTVEGRKVHELNPRKGVRQTALGLLLGFAFISVVMLVMWMTGSYKVSGFNSWSALWPILLMSVQAGIVEEIMSRGIIFRISEDGIGTWWSIVLSALIFGFMHIWNPNATVFSSISIALTAGVILAMLYVVTRQLWVPIGLHIGWNFTLGGIYGAPVSGGDPAGILNTTFPGPDWITGGAFGPEASVITLIVFIVFGIYLIRRSIREKSFIKPMWRS